MDDGKKVLYIRADGNGQIGLGHVMRCLSIADGLRRHGGAAVFVTADEKPAELIRGRGYEMMALGTDYRDMEGEIEALEQALKRRNAGFLLIDSYYANKKYLGSASKWVCTGYLDDYGQKTIPADLILNYNIYADRMPYQKLYLNRQTQLLLGSTYAPLRAEFGNTGYEARPKAQQILVTAGGADYLNIAGQFVEKMLHETAEDMVYHVVSGPFHAYREELLSIGRKYPNVVIHENVTQMAELMAKCDIAVSAAGSTLYELCAVGVPTVYFYFVDNQELPARYFEQDTRMVNAGNFASEPEQTLHHMTAAVQSLIKSYEKRRLISDSMKQITDGHGAERVAECLMAYMERITE